MSAVDLQALHAAGAEITGHADAWLALGRKSAIRNERLDLVAKVRRLHRAFEKRITPGYLLLDDRVIEAQLLKRKLIQ